MREGLTVKAWGAIILLLFGNSPEQQKERKFMRRSLIIVLAFITINIVVLLIVTLYGAEFKLDFGITKSGLEFHFNNSKEGRAR